MRRTPALLTLVLLVLTTLWGAGPAAAGGPTSVLVSVPGAGRVAALSHTDAAYQALDELAGELDAGTGGTAGQRPREGAGEVVTLTWLIHDVQVWRVDQVHLDGKGAPWVATRTVADGGSVWDVSASWHQGNPKLRDLLDELLSDAGPVPADVTEGWSSSAVAAWSGVGVLAGVLLTLAALRRRLRPEPASPPDRATATDQLVWP